MAKNSTKATAKAAPAKKSPRKRITKAATAKNVHAATDYSEQHGKIVDTRSQRMNKDVIHRYDVYADGFEVLHLDYKREESFHE
jgi:hypothetical protein